MTKKEQKRIAQAVAAKKSGEWGFEDAVYPRTDWKDAVGNGDTQLGYFDWVIHQLECFADGF